MFRAVCFYQLHFIFLKIYKKLINSVANYKLENSEQNYNKNDNEIAEELTFTKNNTKLQHSLLFQDEENSEGEFTVYECSGFASVRLI